MTIAQSDVSIAPRKAIWSRLLYTRANHLFSWPWLWLASVLVLLLLGLYNGLVYQPHLDQVHRFAILAMVYFICLAAATIWCGLLVGLLCIRLLGISDPTELTVYERVGLAAGLGLGTLSLGTFILGIVHLFYGAVVAVPLVALPLLLGRESSEAAGLLRALATPAGEASNWRQWRRWSLFTWVDTLARIPMMLLCLAAAAVMVTIDMVFPYGLTGYDTYQYHWAVPMLLLRAHSWLAFPGWAHANLPLGSEMLNLIVLSLGAPQAATLIQDSFLLFIALLTFGLVQRCFGRTAAWLAVIVVVTLPLLLVYSDLSYGEAELVYYGLAAFVVLLHWLDHVLVASKGTTGLCTDVRPLALAGCCIGLALSVKYTALEYVPAAVVMVLFGVCMDSWRVLRTRQVRHRVSPALAGIMAFGVGVALTLGPWLVKDWLLLGDPVYPALPQLFPTPTWDAARSASLSALFASFGNHVGKVAQFRLFAIDLFRRTNLYAETVVVPPGTMAVGSLLAVPFAVYVVGSRLLRGRWPSGQVTLFIASLTLWTVSAFGVWTFSGALVERYALPGIALATILGSALLGWILSSIPHDYFVGIWVATALVCIMSFQNLDADLFQSYASRNPWPVVSGSISEQRYFHANAGAAFAPSFFQAVDYINETLPHNGRLLMLGRGSGYFFTNRDYVADTGGDWVPYLVSEGKTPDGMLAVLHRLGFTYVIYDAGSVSYYVNVYKEDGLAHDVPVYLAFQRQKLIPIGQWGSLSLYRVP